MTRPRILIADDNGDNLYLLRTLLQGHGYDVDEAHHGAEALEMARRHAPALIVSDILMPVMDGFALCREWKRDPALKSIPFVFYTATYTEEKDRAFGLGLGAERFIVKPEEPDSLLAVIGETLQDADGPASARSRSQESLPADDDSVYLKQYNETLIRKLESKMMQLEETNRRLERDIAERKRTEESLQYGQQRFRELFDNMRNAVAVYEATEDGTNFVIRDFNKAAERIERIQRQAIIGRKLTDVFPGVRELGLFDVLQRVLKTGTSEHLPVALYRDDRVMSWRENFVYRLPSGEVVAIYQDVTERRMAEEALRETEGRFRALADNMPDVVARFDLELRHVYVNRRIESVTGRSAGAFIGKTNRELGMPAPLVEQWEAASRQALATGETTQIRFDIPTPDGVRHYESRLIPEKGKDGKPFTLLSLARDITDRTKAEEAAESQMEELRRWYSLTLGREDRIAELKREVNSLAERLGIPLPYAASRTTETEITP